MAIESMVLLFVAEASDAQRLREGSRELQNDPNLSAAAQRVTFDVLAEHLSEDQLRAIIAFMKTDAGKAFGDAQLALARERPAAIVLALHPAEAPEVAQAKRTMADMVSLAMASEAYAIDANRYPDGFGVDDLRAAIVPKYIKNVPVNDAWGTPFAYRVDSAHQTYRFISAGPDRKFDKSSLDINRKPVKSDDILYENGEFLQAPLKLK